MNISTATVRKKKIIKRNVREERKNRRIEKLENKNNQGDGGKKQSRGANAPGGIIKRILAPQAIIKRTRHIPQHIRDEVFRRDDRRCSFIDPDGKRCGSRWDLEIDRIIPYARGGDNSPGNLRLLCAGHNKLEAERIYGKDFMNRRRR
jgi:hypothetical protein